MSWGAERALRGAAEGRASTRVRCETGNPRQAPTRLRRPSRAHTLCPRPPRNHIYSSFFLFPSPPFPVTFSPNRKVKCKSRFAAGGPGSPLSDSGSWSGVRCSDAANPGDGVGTLLSSSTAPRARPLRRGRPRSARGPRPGGTGALRARRVAGLAAGSSARLERGWSPRLCKRLLPRSAPSPEFSVPRRSRDPSPGPPSGAEPPAWGPNPGALLPGPGPRSGASQEQRGGSAWKKKSDFLSTLHRCNLESAGNGSNTHPAPLQSALVLLKGSSSHQSLATPSPPPERPAQVCKEGCEICKVSVF